jgi:hypothetical protein
MWALPPQPKWICPVKPNCNRSNSCPAAILQPIQYSQCPVYHMSSRIINPYCSSDIWIPQDILSLLSTLLWQVRTRCFRLHRSQAITRMADKSSDSTAGSTHHAGFLDWINPITVLGSKNLSFAIAKSTDSRSVSSASTVGTFETLEA